jgi:hypothetical protein
MQICFAGPFRESILWAAYNYGSLAAFADSSKVLSFLPTEQLEVLRLGQ